MYADKSLILYRDNDKVVSREDIAAIAMKDNYSWTICLASMDEVKEEYMEHAASYVAVISLDLEQELSRLRI